MLDEPGIHGLLPHGGDRRARLLVTDDSACDRVSSVVNDVRAGMITVCEAAARCAALLERDASWRAGAATAMICRSLRTMPTAALPRDLTLRPVRRVDADDLGGVGLADAVAAACRADPEVSGSRALAEHLRSLPTAFALWAAVDHGGVVPRHVGLSRAFEARGDCDLRQHRPRLASSRDRAGHDRRRAARGRARRSAPGGSRRQPRR